ncbi:MAG: FecR family protein [Syntrophothermus sp.]
MKLFPKTIDSQFLVRVIKNEVSTEEKEFFESWLHESEKNKEEFGNFILLWDKTGTAKIPPPPDAAMQFSRIKERITAQQAEAAENISSEEVRKLASAAAKRTHTGWLSGIIHSGIWESYSEFFKWGTGIAAGIAAVILVINIFFSGNDVMLPEITDMSGISPKNYEMYTARGERNTVTLSDGSIVYLNSNSKLVYPKTFSGKDRQIELRGEAYFAVAHDPSKPFRVKTGSSTTEVVGTEFNLRYRSEKMELVVAKGAVKAYRNNSDKFVSVTRGSMVTYNPEKGFTLPQKVNVHRYTAWRENKLSFVQAQLFEVMNEIEIYYNVQVIYKNRHVRNKTLTGIFDADSLDHVLSMIALTMNMDIHREGKKIIVN